MGSEREQDDWLGRTLRQAPASASGACLDAETLAAWSDGGLSATAAAAVELHASSCSRCTAVLAEMARSTPAAPSTHVWTPARMFRWLAPLAAAATVIAIWVVVPSRPIAPPLPAHDLAAPGAPIGIGGGPRPPEAEPQKLDPAIQPQANRTFSPEPQGQLAPSARLEKPAAEEQMRLRDELKRESTPPQAQGAAADSAAKTPPAAAPVPVAPDTLAATGAASAQRSAFTTTLMSTESISPISPLIHWRITAPASIERSTDGGSTWIRTTSPASAAVVGVRAVDADRAVVSTADKAQFYTTNGGVSWTRVQENSAAPF